MVFEKKGWFDFPTIPKSTKRRYFKEKFAQVKRMELFNELLNNEKMMGFGTYKDRLREKAVAEEAAA